MNLHQDHAAAKEKQLLASNCEGLAAQLKALGVTCKGIAVLDVSGEPVIAFEETAESFALAVQQVFIRAQQDGQLALSKDGQSGYLIGYPVLTTDGAVKQVFIIALESISEQTVAVVRLAMGWLHLPMLQIAAERGAQALQLLEMQANVLSHEKSRGGAQDWVNRLAQFLRSGDNTNGSVLYFRMLDPGSLQPRWWVTSDTASAEKGTAILHLATDAASAVALECQEIQLNDIWGMPVIHCGDVIGVLVVVGATVDAPGKQFFRTCASSMGVVLSQWQQADRSLWAHFTAWIRESLRKLHQPGHLTWKVGAVSLMLLMGVLLLIPFEDNAVAKVVVEGQQQQVIAASFEGYWSEVLVRPGDTVQAGQLMARLDDKDFKVEREKLQSEVDQTNGKLRQALSDDDPPAAQQLMAQSRQINAQLDLINAKIRRAEIRAPVSGVIIFGDWYDQVGSPIEAGKKLFELAVGDGYRVVLQVPEEEIARVLRGQKGELRLTGLPHQGLDFVVNRITSVAALDDRKNTFRVEAQLLDPAVPIRPGMQGVGKIVVTHSNLLTIWLRPVAQWARMKLWSMWW